jgi:hypothetical protein
VTVNISPAALVRSIGDNPPTLLLDEADTVFGAKDKDANEDLRDILSAGHGRNRALCPLGCRAPGDRPDGTPCQAGG